MKMKLVFAILALFLAILMAQIQAQSYALTNDVETTVAELDGWFPHPPKPSPHFDHDQKKCHKAIKNPDFHACLTDLQKYLKTHKIAISPDCCSALTKIEKACPIFKARHPILWKITKKYCPSAAPSPN